jgi:hypothetical protein
MTDQPSGKLYAAVTRYWPRIAAGLVVGIGVVEFVVGGLTADTGVEFYLMAWAATTGGLWFLFEKAESALSDEGRQQVSSLLRSDVQESISSIPRQFAHLFDRVFGERHLTLRCLLSSALASTTGVIVVTALWIAFAFPIEGIEYNPELGMFDTRTTVDLAGALTDALAVGLVFSVLINALPDYISLLETRFLLRKLERGGRLGRLLVLDLALTAALSYAAVIATVAVLFHLPGPTGDPTVNESAEVGVGIVRGYLVKDLLSLRPELGDLYVPGIPWQTERTLVSEASFREEHTALIANYWEREEEYRTWIEARGFEYRHIPASWSEWGFPMDLWGGWVGEGVPFGIFFYSAFFTSIWLWLYAASAVLTNVLLRMNSGVGFLLRVTDVERQPFRSMGFVSVIVVTGLFALGLPLVLL